MEMKNKIYIAIFSLLILASSCAKLDLTPTDSISPDKAYRNLTDINMGILGAYAMVDYSPMSMVSTV